MWQLVRLLRCGVLPGIHIFILLSQSALVSQTAGCGARRLTILYLMTCVRPQALHVTASPYRLSFCRNERLPHLWSFHIDTASLHSFSCVLDRTIAAHLQMMECGDPSSMACFDPSSCASGWVLRGQPRPTYSHGTWHRQLHRRTPCRLLHLATSSGETTPEKTLLPYTQRSRL